MARPNVAALGMLIASALFMVAAAIPAVRGDDFNTVLFVLAVAFLLIAFVLHKKGGGGTESGA